MKSLLLAILAALSAFAADSAPAPARTTPVAKAALKPADREKFLRLQATYAAIAAAKDAEKKLALQPIELEFEAFRAEKCLKLGMPRKDIAAQCVIDSDESIGKGSGEVRWEKPAAPEPVAAGDKPAPRK